MSSPEELLRNAKQALEEGKDIARAERLAQTVLSRIESQPIHKAVAYSTLSKCYLYRSQLERIPGVLEEARRHYREAGRGASVLRTYLTEISALQRLDRFEQADRLLQGLGDQLRACTDARTRVDFAEVRMLQEAVKEQFEAALAIVPEVRKELGRLNDPERTAAFLQNLANIYIGVDRFREAAETLDAAYQIADQSSSSLRLTFANNLAMIYAARGEFATALRHADQAYPLVSEGILQDDSASFLLTRAEILLRLGCPREAEAEVDRAGDLLASANAPRVQAEASAMRARILSHRDPIAALPAFEKAIQEHVALRFRTTEGYLRLDHCRLLNRLQQGDEALSAAEELIRSQTESRGLVLRGQVEKAEALRIIGNGGAAEQVLDDMQEELNCGEHPGVRLPWLLVRARVLESKGYADAALETWRAAVEQCESVGEMLRDPGSRLGWTNQNFEAFERLLSHALRKSPTGLPNPEEVLVQMERTRSRTLLSLVTAGLSLRDDQLEARRLEEIKVQYRWFQEREREALALGKPVDAYRKSRRSLESEAAGVLRSVEKLGGRGLSRRPPNLAELQGELQGVDLVEFVALDEGVWVLHVTADSARVIPLNLSLADLRAMEHEFRFHLEGMLDPSLAPLAGEAIEALVTRLRDGLFTPLGELGARSLVIPHGVLHDLPLEAALPDHTEVSVLPGSSFLPLLRRRFPSSICEKALILGVANEHAPGAEHEARAVGDMLQEAKVLAGDSAVAAVVTTAARDATLIHLAGHLESHPENPDFTVFHMHDEVLAPFDFRGIQFPGSLVFLSACSTGTGPISRSDDVMAFHRAFLARGASAMIVTLWPIEDVAAQEMAYHFYRALAGGAEPARALAQSRREMKQAGRSFHQWASHRYIGPPLQGIANPIEPSIG